MHVRKDGLNPRVVQDLRRQFRIRSAQKKHLPPRDLAEKTRKGHSKTKRKSKHSATSVPGNGTGTGTGSKTDGTGSGSGSATSKGSWGGMKKPANDDDPPTEFEKVENAKPAHFANEYHKMEPTGTAVSPQSQAQPSSSGVSYSVKRERKKPKDKKRKGSRRRSRRDSNNTPTASTSVSTTTSIVERRSQDDQPGGKKSRSSMRRRKDGSAVAVPGAKIDKERHNRKKSHESPNQRSPGKEALREKDKSAPSSEAPPSSSPISARSSKESLKSFDEDNEISGRSVAQARGFLVPVNDANFKLQPVTNDKTKCSEAEEVTAVEDEVHEPAVMLKENDHTLLDCDKFGNANFSLVDSAIKVIDYCHENDYFQEITDPPEYVIFNDFFCGKSKFDDKVLSLIESMLETILDSRKLAEVPALAQPLKLLGKDRAEGRNNLLDALISKKATVGDNMSAPTQGTNNTTGNSNSATQSQSSIDTTAYSTPSEDLSKDKDTKDKEESSEQRSG